MDDTKLQELETKVAKLEEEIREIRKLVADGSSMPWWERTAGMFKDDPVFAEIIRLGQKLRREELIMEFKKAPKSSRRKAHKRNSGLRQIQKGK
jgi:hypothetical protein